MSLLGPLIGRALSGLEDPLLILPDNTCQDICDLLQMVWDQVYSPRSAIANSTSNNFRKLLVNFLNISSPLTTGQISDLKESGQYLAQLQPQNLYQGFTCQRLRGK